VAISRSVHRLQGRERGLRGTAGGVNLPLRIM
jgi:hypothetical protein